MSRSYLRNKYIQKKVHYRRRYKGPDLDHLKLIPESSTGNEHKRDEMPKNSPSKFIRLHCSASPDMIEIINKPTYCSGHKTGKGGHRRVSGLVRANLKRETQKKIKEELED